MKFEDVVIVLTFATGLFLIGLTGVALFRLFGLMCAIL